MKISIFAHFMQQRSFRHFDPFNQSRHKTWFCIQMTNIYLSSDWYNGMLIYVYQILQIGMWSYWNRLYWTNRNKICLCTMATNLHLNYISTNHNKTEKNSVKIPTLRIQMFSSFLLQQSSRITSQFWSPCQVFLRVSSLTP